MKLKIKAAAELKDLVSVLKKLDKDFGDLRYEGSKSYTDVSSIRLCYTISADGAYEEYSKHVLSITKSLKSWSVTTQSNKDNDECLIFFYTSTRFW